MDRIFVYVDFIVLKSLLFAATIRCSINGKIESFKFIYLH